MEARPSHRPQRLQKQKSETGIRARSRAQAGLPEGVRSTTSGQPTGEADGVRARRGSIRNAMRRIFGRRSREPEQLAPSMLAPTQGGYQQAEPSQLAAQPELPEQLEAGDALTPRTVSASPLTILPTIPFQRVRSPYAVEFPRSARLKPLNLGNPFDAPGSQLRRRKTEPTIQPLESDATAQSGSNESSDEIAASVTRSYRDKPRASGKKAARDKRKSRSADDLVHLSSDTNTPPRKRSEEIQYWRDSFQGSVSHGDGFGSFLARQSIDEPNEDKFSNSALGASEGASRTQAGTPSHYRDLSGDVVPPSAVGTELARELEDRVAKLEAGLHSFRGQLAQMTATRNRRTVVVGDPTDVANTRRAERTASMLALDLQTDIAPSSYRYDYSRTMRPSSSPDNPKTPPRMAPPLPVASRYVDHPFVESSQPAPQKAPSTPPEREILAQAMPQPTFKALYEMLSDERAARRRLELQMEGLRTELATLHHQVSEQSNFQSQRSSFIPMTDAIAGSSRLQDFLRGTDTSPASVGVSRWRQARNRSSIEQRAMISRFSGSESEHDAVGEPEESTTYANYRVPDSAYVVGGQRTERGGLFF